MERPAAYPTSTLLIEKTYEDAIVPTKAYDTDSGFDVYAYSFKVYNGFAQREIIINEPFYLLRTGDRVLIDVGIKATVVGVDSALHTEDRFNQTYTYEIQVRPRSGLAYKCGITVLNTPGTVDNAYRASLGVILINHSDVPFKINRGDKIAQIVPVRVELPQLKVVTELPSADRGVNGLGSTGV